MFLLIHLTDLRQHATSLVLYENAVEGASFAKLEADFDLERSLAQTASLRLSVEPLNKDFTKHDLEVVLPILTISSS